MSQLHILLGSVATSSGGLRFLAGFLLSVREGELILHLGCTRECAGCRSKCPAPKEMQQSEQVSGCSILLCWLPDKTVRLLLGEAFTAPIFPPTCVCRPSYRLSSVCSFLWRCRGLRMLFSPGHRLPPPLR